MLAQEEVGPAIAILDFLKPYGTFRFGEKILQEVIDFPVIVTVMASFKRCGPQGTRIFDRVILHVNTRGTDNISEWYSSLTDSGINVICDLFDPVLVVFATKASG
jgi:hypothetical protein